MAFINRAEPSHIGINAHLLSGQQGYRQAGIHRYVSNLINHLQNRKHTYTVYTNNPSALNLGPNFTTTASRWPLDRRLVRILWEQLAWPWQSRRKVDLIHSMAFVLPVVSFCPGVVTIYDLSFEFFPKSFPLLQRLYLASQTRRSCRTAQMVAAISESTRQNINQLYGTPLDKIDVVRPGVSSIFKTLPADEVAAFRAKQELPAQFILHVGTIQPRKNLPLLVDALETLQRDDVYLVLVGGRGWDFEEVYKKVNEAGLTKRVRFAGYVPDSELPLWYNAASVLVFPSAHEGFGLPVLEAMACGTPVIAANTSALPEVVDQAAFLYENPNLAELTDRIAKVLDDPYLMVKMQEMGRDQASKFTWQKAGQDMAEVYTKALSAR